jgi:hypothetical protein
MDLNVDNRIMCLRVSDNWIVYSQKREGERSYRLLVVTFLKSLTFALYWMSTPASPFWPCFTIVS